MAWVRIDDHMADDLRIIEAGPEASWLYVCGLMFCNRGETDGFIPAAKATALFNMPGLGRKVAKLVRVGLWNEVPGGYQVRNYLKFQPSAATLRERRRKAAERQAEQRRRTDVTTREVTA